MMHITVRPATLADARALAEHNMAAAAESEGLRMDEATALAGVEAVLRHPEIGRYFIAETASGVAGSLMITYEWRDWRNKMSWWIQSVFTRPAFRKKGVYAALYQYILELARQEGIYSVRLYAEKDNLAAQTVYRKLGMKQGEYLMFDQTL
jgi:GNAT superfamily N-acetyltransferase